MSCLAALSPPAARRCTATDTVAASLCEAFCGTASGTTTTAIYKYIHFVSAIVGVPNARRRLSGQVIVTVLAPATPSRQDSTDRTFRLVDAHNFRHRRHRHHDAGDAVMNRLKNRCWRSYSRRARCQCRANLATLSRS